MSEEPSSELFKQWILYKCNVYPELIRKIIKMVPDLYRRPQYSDRQRIRYFYLDFEVTWFCHKPHDQHEEEHQFPKIKKRWKGIAAIEQFMVYWFHIEDFPNKKSLEDLLSQADECIVDSGLIETELEGNNEEIRYFNHENPSFDNEIVCNHCWIERSYDIKEYKEVVVYFTKEEIITRSYLSKYPNFYYSI